MITAFKLDKIKSLFKKKEKINFGYVDYLWLGRASGWVYSKEHQVKFVSMFIGDLHIKRCEIKEVRNDINKLFNIKNKTGFKLFFNVNDNIQTNKKDYRFVVEDNAKKELFEIDLIKELKSSTLISEILKSQYYGYDGYVDGFNNQGLLSGWAAARGEDNPIIIWMQSNGLIPQEIICDKWLYDLSSNKISSMRSFEIDTKYLPSELSQRKISFTFDKEGLYPLSGNNKIVLPQINNNISIKDTQDNNKDDEINELQKSLKEFRKTLDLLDKR
jgi:hypothetical protein